MMTGPQLMEYASRIKPLDTLFFDELPKAGLVRRKPRAAGRRAK